jgi:hypothetical protein
MEPSLTSVLYGNKVCLLSYGATTSTMKEETLIGNHAAGSWGIVHLTLNRIFELIASQDSAVKSSKVYLSILMLNHEWDFIDLLAASATSSNHEASCIECTSLEASYEAVEGAMTRRLDYTMNDPRSLLTSHLLININVETINITSNTRCEGSLMFVDLANSERIKPTESNAKYFRDCQSNHRTLAVLRDVLTCVAKKKPRMKLQSQHIPYRNSKLTLFLQDYLQLGLCKIILMTHISSSPNQLVESVNSLTFAKLITADERLEMQD